MFFERYTNLIKLLNLPDAKLDLPHIDLHGVTLRNAGRYGESYSEKLGLSSHPALLLTSILEKECGLPIFYLELPDGASAISLISNGSAAICVNSRDTPWRQRFDIAHEMFHIIHQSANTTACGTSDDQYIEKLANAFAAGLLLPQRMIENEIDILRKAGNIDIVALVAMACNMGVSLPALIWRLVNIRRMKPITAENILRSDAVKEHDKTLRRKEYTNSPHISQRYVSMVFEAMGRGVMSRMRAAEYLDVPYIKLDDVLRSEGLTYNEKRTVKVAIM
jgi:Zn-dependent peptidase ImmA (M78 family)